MPIGPTEGYAKHTPKIDRALAKLKKEIAAEEAQKTQIQQRTGRIAGEVFERANRPHDVPKGAAPSDDIQAVMAEIQQRSAEFDKLVQEKLG